MASEIQAPYKFEKNYDVTYVFLAGTVEMGIAQNWQQEIIDFFKNDDRVCFLNPRRDDWDSSWKQSIDDPQFKEQVEWELSSLERSDMIVMYFDPNTKSPISMMEFGIYCMSKKMTVCCPEGFWRKGNVDVVCERYNTPTACSMLALKYAIKHKIETS